MRCAKFGQGTNSYFIWMPVLAVKSLDSSTSALAGSQAAQHKRQLLLLGLRAEAHQRGRRERARRDRRLGLLGVILVSC